MDRHRVGWLALLLQPQLPDEAAGARLAGRALALAGRQVVLAVLVVLLGAVMGLAPVAFWLLWFRGR